MASGLHLCVRFIVDLVADSRYAEWINEEQLYDEHPFKPRRRSKTESTDDLPQVVTMPAAECAPGVDTMEQDRPEEAEANARSGVRVEESVAEPAPEVKVAPEVKEEVATPRASRGRKVAVYGTVDGIGCLVPILMVLGTDAEGSAGKRRTGTNTDQRGAYYDRCALKQAWRARLLCTEGMLQASRQHAPSSRRGRKSAPWKTA